MKTIVYFIFTCFISTGAMFGALNAKNPYPLFIVAFGIWALFIWGCHRRWKRKAARQRREQFYDEQMREMLRRLRR